MSPGPFWSGPCSTVSQSWAQLRNVDCDKAGPLGIQVVDRIRRPGPKSGWLRSKGQRKLIQKDRRQVTSQGSGGVINLQSGEQRPVNTEEATCIFTYKDTYKCGMQAYAHMRIYCHAHAGYVDM